ncbi:MAG TPA: DUF952 domain-containing protein [Nocardioides sp.]|nr:DUF952 domain-containing protein [Nocardioides sp.]
MATIFHIALASEWAAARERGVYTTSTLGRSLAEEGFIHASRADQWPGVRERFYGGVTEPLVLLQIDTDRLDVPVVEEPPAPGVAETFPHLYGPLRVDAVVRALPLPPSLPPDGSTRPERATFSSVFLGEMFAHLLLASVVLLGVVLGIAGGAVAGSPEAMLAGAAVGALVGLATARALYVRRERARTA